MKCSLHIGTKLSREHNTRRYKDHEKEWNVDGHIRPERTELNETLVDVGWKDFYNETFGDAVKEFNDKQIAQGHANRCKGDYLQECMDSKGVNAVYEAIIQVGDSKEHPSDEEAKAFFKDYLSHWEEKNPNFVVIGAYIHLDEQTPHLHLDFVPVAKDLSRGMRVQNSQTKALEQMGYVNTTGKRDDNPMTVFTERERTDLEKIASEHFKGQIEPSTPHSKRTVQKHKEYFEHNAEQKIKELTEQVESLEQQVAQMQMTKTSYKSVYDMLGITSEEVEQAQCTLKGTIEVNASKLERLNEITLPNPQLVRADLSLNRYL